jgi:hypothetical protein
MAPKLALATSGLLCGELKKVGAHLFGLTGRRLPVSARDARAGIGNLTAVKGTAAISDKAGNRAAWDDRDRPGVRDLRENATMPSVIRYGLLVAALLVLPLAAGTSQEPNIEARIAARIQAETDCRVDYISKLRDLREASPPRVEARVHCRDGEAYDVDWQLSPDRFRFEPCEDNRAVCQATQ